MFKNFSFGYLLTQKSPTAEIIGIYSIGTIVPLKYMPIISTVGRFCIHKFEDSQTRKCLTFLGMSKFKTKIYLNLTAQIERIIYWDRVTSLDRVLSSSKKRIFLLTIGISDFLKK